MGHRIEVCLDIMLEALLQLGMALVYYFGLVLLMRLAGKRMAGQVAMFDLLVLITLGVVLQKAALRDGRENAILFVATVLGAHLGLARACARSQRLRRLVRGAPRPLIEHGEVSFAALAEESLSYEDLLAGLRKLGYSDPRTVRLATLEETGHISVVAESEPGMR